MPHKRPLIFGCNQGPYHAHMGGRVTQCGASPSHDRRVNRRLNQVLGFFQRARHEHGRTSPTHHPSNSAMRIAHLWQRCNLKSTSPFAKRQGWLDFVDGNGLTERKSAFGKRIDHGRRKIRLKMGFLQILLIRWMLQNGAAIAVPMSSYRPQLPLRLRYIYCPCAPHFFILIL